MAKPPRFRSGIPSSEITPESLYLDRRSFMRGATALAATGLLTGACGSPGDRSAAPAVGGPDGSLAAGATVPPPAATRASGTKVTLAGPDAPPTALATADELGDPLNAFDEITGYNNYYEFTTDKEAVAGLAADFPTSPWTVQVGGLVEKPQTFAIEDLLAQFDQEERVYRHRCVEGWSMVMPWVGFPLRKLLDVVAPTSKAKYVRFETVADPEHMPGYGSGPYTWPYVEGLRLDEAMNDLAFMVTGLYGKVAVPQNGAPLRLAVPWKYGFKSIKSIVKIDLVEEQPTSLWMDAAPDEYGFYANVNPDVPHPRWSQSSERRIGELRRRRTLPFNGYGDQVGYLYNGMDLETYF